MERTWISESVFNVKKGVWKCFFCGGGLGGGGTEILGVWVQLGGLWKIGEVKGKGEYQPSEKQDSG